MTAWQRLSPWALAGIFLFGLLLIPAGAWVFVLGWIHPGPWLGLAGMGLVVAGTCCAVMSCVELMARRWRARAEAPAR